MRVLHIAAGNLYGGVETLLATLARQRKECTPMEPHFALCFEGKLAGTLRETSVAVHLLGRVRVRRPWTIWRARRNLADLFRQTPLDLAVCHSVWPHAIFAPVIRSAGIPLLIWLHDRARGKHWLERWARRTSPDFVVCNSQFTAGALKNLFPDVGFEVVYCPVPVADFPFQDRSQVRAELNTPNDAVVVIQVSRLERWKGHLLHLEALGKLRNDPGWVAWFVGGAQRPQEAHYLAELESRAAQLSIADRIRFLGQRSDVPRLLACSDIHCQPNTGPEPFGITFVEGMLAGLPVVTTAMGGALEIVDSSCGVLVPPDDPAALATCLRQLILDADMRSRLGKSGPSRARLLCDPTRQMGKIAEFFHQTLKQNLAA